MSVRRAYSHDGSDGAYSDDFISDEDRRTHSPYNNCRTVGNTRDTIRARGGSYPRGRGRGKGRRGGGHGNSRASEPISLKYDNVTKRVLSASRNRVNELKNQVEEMKILIRDLEAENKLFKKLQYRQEKAIRNFEDKENDLPRILDKHSNEIRTLKDQNRKLREKYERTDHYLRDAEDELERVKKRMNKYKDMCEQKELLERDELSRKLTKAEIDMEERDVRIKELERHMEILKKNHRHELGIEIARQKELKRQMEEMTNKNSEVENQLKEKSKQLEYKNIYTLSINRASSHENASVDASPSRKIKKQASLTDLTPRDKAKFYEEKRREEVRKQKEVKAVLERKKRKKWEAEEKQKEIEQAKSEHPTRAAPDFNFKTLDYELEEKEREESRRRSYREEQEEYRRQSEKEQQELMERKRELERRQDQDRWKQDEADREQRQREERERRQREDRERDERDRRERDERDRKERDDREMREREEWERREEEERLRKERVEREREKVEKERREREKEEQERRAQLDNDPVLREERRKKDELLRKLQDMDKIGNNPILKKEPEPFSFNSKENTGGYDTPSSKRSDPKEYSFTKPINNLHKGKPAREDVTVPYIQRKRQQTAKEDDNIGGYQPSFGPSRGGGGVGTKPATKPFSLFDDEPPSTLKFDTSATKKTEKNTNLLENLFGPQTATNNKTQKLSKGQENETFFITGNSPTSEKSKRQNNTTTTSAFPWDNVSSPSKTNTSRLTIDRGGSSTLFGGGAAVIDDDLSSNGNRALPRRGRQQNVSTFAAKPSVMAVDTFEDDIEEVVL